MAIYFDLTARHRVQAANSHYYKEPTEPLYLDRVLQYHDLIYLVSGRWAIVEDETEYPLEADDVLLLTAGHHHYTRLPCLPQTRTMCIHVSCESGDQAGREGVLTLPTLLRVKGSPAVRRGFEEIISAMWSGNPHAQERMSALFTLLALDLKEAEAQQQEAPSLADGIIREINANPHRQFRVQDMADKYFVSTKTIENAMRRSVGTSFSKYQMSRKLEMVAMQLRVEPEIRLSEIAQGFGFCDEFHMSKAFKQKYGMSPTAYRRKENEE